MLKHGEAKPLKESSLNLLLQNCKTWVFNFLLVSVAVVNLGLSGFLPPKQVILEESCTEKPTREREPSKPRTFSYSEKFLCGGFTCAALHCSFQFSFSKASLLLLPLPLI